jgi:tRNA-dihydrouridine synthase 1
MMITCWRLGSESVCVRQIAKRGNYGAFLMDDPERVRRIVSAMSQQLSVPVTVKIR